MPTIIKIKSEEHFQDLIHGGKPVLVDYYADWCGPCRAMEPVLKAIAKDREDVIVAKLDTEKKGLEGLTKGVTSIPAFAVFIGGEKIGNRKTGTCDIEEMGKFLDAAIRKAEREKAPAEAAGS